MSNMKVRVRLFGGFQERYADYAPADGLVIDIRDGITVKGLLDQLEIPTGAGAIVITEGRVLATTDQLKTDSEIDIMRPIYGG